MSHYVKFKNQYYILATSSLADDRTMVLKHGDCFGVFDRYGDIHPIGQGAQGLYHHGMRYLSRMELLIDNKRPLILSSGLKEENELLTADLSNPDIEIEGGLIIEKGTLHIHRTKFMWKDVTYENIRLCNFGVEPLTFTLCINFSADFNDIFEIRGIQRTSKGKILKTRTSKNEIMLGYQGRDEVKRRTRIKLDPAPTLIKGHTATYQITMLPKACDYISAGIAFESGNDKPEIFNADDAYKKLLHYLGKMKDNNCDIYTSSEQFNEWLSRSKSDMATMVSETEYGLYPYAGVPWYSTPFGRDGIITAWECLWMNPDLTKGVLNYLAKTQATQLNSFQDAEPGKIFHEKRGGEMAELGEIPFKMYYGTIDATPLFVALAGAYYERTGDIETIRDIWPNIEMALEWMDKYGDIDGDGFLEYAKKSEKGLVNQGWKDSHDSVFHEDGTMAKAPIALAEVQAYAYDAKVKAGDLARELGYDDKANALYQQAEDLKEKFHRVFWSEEKETFVLALDGDKKPCNVNSSNAGHALFSGIVKPEYAERLSKTLLDEKMYSGWGIRTIAIDESRYNPMSYHNGSIWPHDNAMIAYGLGLYGYKQEVHKVIEGLFDLTTYVDAQRLPELFCGFDKRKNEGPTAYPVACSPQAWAVASVYMLLQASLGIRIVAKNNTIYFYNPTLPDFLDEITITNLKVNGASVVLQIRKNINEITVNILHRNGDVKVEIINDRLPIDRVEVLEKAYK
ncbi:MAG: amylo-alpha-1,6-glucosidase [Cytophagaceae bacterium]|nr:amylo-alpha-1,6-glucosidase [Cytophagaceae bacterium]